MARLSARQYQWRLLVTMMVYVGAMLLVWPAARSAARLPLKVVLAIAPLLPMFYALTLMARRIRDSDELEQRTHLIALGVATGLTAALSLLGGFLSAAGVLPLDGSILIWVFPFMMVCYGATRAHLTRTYGGEFGCDDGSHRAVALRLLLLAAMAGAVALYGWRHGWDDFRLGLACGTLVGLVLVALLKGLARRPPKEQAGV